MGKMSKKSRILITFLVGNFPYSRFGDADDDDGAASVAASKSSKLPVLDKLGVDDGNISVGSVTNVVKDRVGNLLGKGIGGLSTKFGSGSWF